MSERPRQPRSHLKRQHAVAGHRRANARKRASTGPDSPTPRNQASADLRRHAIRPDEIRPGDWLRDLGTLRQAAAVEETPSAISPGRTFIVQFIPQPGVEDRALGIASTVTTVTVWRES
jgi:hypothetical protein